MIDILDTGGAGACVSSSDESLLLKSASGMSSSSSSIVFFFGGRRSVGGGRRVGGGRSFGRGRRVGGGRSGSVVARLLRDTTAELARHDAMALAMALAMHWRHAVSVDQRLVRALCTPTLFVVCPALRNYFFCSQAVPSDQIVVAPDGSASQNAAKHNPEQLRKQREYKLFTLQPIARPVSIYGFAQTASKQWRL